MKNKALAFSLLLGAFVINANCCAQTNRGVWSADSNSSSSSNSKSSISATSNPAAIQQQYAYRQMRPGMPVQAGRTAVQRGYPQQYGASRAAAAGQYAGGRAVNQGGGNYPQSRTPIPNQSSGRNVGGGGRGQLNDYNETVDGRTYTVHLPRSYNAANPTPVVIVFHGLGMNGMSVRGLSAMDIPAERNGFITVYPDGVGGRWNDGIQRSGLVDDVSFVSDMLDSMSKKFKVDNRRVYACGISNGGFFVQRLACDLSNKIAAVGVVAASAGDAVCRSCSSHRGVPVVFFMGTDDPLLPREGETKDLGKLGETLGLADLGIKNMSSTVGKVAGVLTCDEAAEFWARNNNCSAHPREENLPDRDTRDGCKVKRETYTGSNEVVVYTIEGGGHSWPGGMGFVAQDIIGKTCNDINASEIMWQFFQGHSR